MKHTLALIELAERLTMSGEIGDGMVARFHELAALARLELRNGKAELSREFTRMSGRKFTLAVAIDGERIARTAGTRMARDGKTEATYLDGAVKATLTNH